MDPLLKGMLSGIPVVVLVGGTHHIVKKLRETKPVLYWGSIIGSAGLAFAILHGIIKAPFMNAEEDDLYYCSKCDEGFSSINPTDEGQFCDSCLPSSATLHDEMERITMDAETFEADPEYDGMNYHGDLPYDVMKDAYAQARKKGRNPIIRDGKRVSPSERMNWEYIEVDDETIDSGYITAYFEDPKDSQTEHYLRFDFDVSDVTPHEYGFWNYDSFNFDPVNPKGYANYIINYGEDAGKILSSHRFTSMGAETFEASGTKKPKLTPKQKQALDMMKYSYGANKNEYAYVEVDNRGWKPHRTRQVQALLDKGLIEIDKAENRDYYGYIKNYKAYIVKLTPLAWEYKYEDPFGKYTPGSMYQQDGDKMV